MIVKFDYTELENIEDAETLLTESGIKIIGCAVTTVKTFRDILREAQKLSLFIKSPHKRAEKAANKEQKKEEKKNRKKSKKKKDR